MRFAAPGALIAHTLDEALATAAAADEVFVIGGGELYRAALPLAQRLLLTEIRREFAGDTFFPAFDRAAFPETSRQPQPAVDGLEYDFVEYLRR
jgi:dihydrofolate reductase